jgi:hypothetical protein
MIEGYTNRMLAPEEIRQVRVTIRCQRRGVPLLVSHEVDIAPDCAGAILAHPAVAALLAKAQAAG